MSELGQSPQGRPSGKSSHVRYDADCGPNSASQRNDAKCRFCCRTRLKCRRKGDVARSLVGTEAFEQSRRDRKRIEMRFAHLKRILRLNRLRLRGLRGAQDEFTLAAIAHNLRRLAKLVTEPPPLAARRIVPA
jgi:hypothetical protein